MGSLFSSAFGRGRNMAQADSVIIYGDDAQSMRGEDSQGPGRAGRKASRVIASCLRVVLVFSSCFLRILFVFSWYSALFSQALPSRSCTARTAAPSRLGFLLTGLRQRRFAGVRPFCRRGGYAARPGFRLEVHRPKVEVRKKPETRRPKAERGWMTAVGLCGILAWHNESNQAFDGRVQRMRRLD